MLIDYLSTSLLGHSDVCYSAGLMELLNQSKAYKPLTRIINLKFFLFNLYISTYNLRLLTYLDIYSKITRSFFQFFFVLKWYKN